MAEQVSIPQLYREEFEQLGVFELRKRLEASTYNDADKQKHGWAWLDEQANAEERAYRARQLTLQERNDFRSNISLLIAVVAVIISAVALYRTGH
jgi:ABC-type uncharacterized transport system permease subunit